jgi:hypothetical protein
MDSNRCPVCGNLHCDEHSLEYQDMIRARDYEELSLRDKAALRGAEERERSSSNSA